MSIHPRMDYPQDQRRVGHSTKPYKGKSKNLRRRQKRLNERRNAHSITLRSVGAKAQAGFRQPGSMKQRT